VSEPAPRQSATARRVAENDARFREANERISAAAERADLEPIPFICECANPRCRAILRLTRAEYEDVRASGRRFLSLPGHEAAAMGWERVVDRRDGYFVVEKIGEAAEMVEDMNPRARRGTDG
jgi:hypothetical protein